MSAPTTLNIAIVKGQVAHYALSCAACERVNAQDLARILLEIAFELGGPLAGRT